jgi:hypothetical protein
MDSLPKLVNLGRLDKNLSKLSPYLLKFGNFSPKGEISSNLVALHRDGQDFKKGVASSEPEHNFRK